MTPSSQSIAVQARELRGKHPLRSKNPGSVAEHYLKHLRPNLIYFNDEHLDWEAANTCLASLLHDETSLLSEGRAARLVDRPLLGGIASEEEARALEELNVWVVSHGLAAGEMQYDFVDPETGEQRAILDLAWPQGVQSELSEPVCVLLDETAELISLASAAGFRCFTGTAEFRAYAERLTAANVAAE